VKIVSNRDGKQEQIGPHKMSSRASKKKAGWNGEKT